MSGSLILSSGWDSYVCKNVKKEDTARRFTILGKNTLAGRKIWEEDCERVICIHRPLRNSGTRFLVNVNTVCNLISSLNNVSADNSSARCKYSTLVNPLK